MIDVPVSGQVPQMRPEDLHRVHVRTLRQQLPPFAVRRADVQNLRVPCEMLPDPRADLRLAVIILVRVVSRDGCRAIEANNTQASAVAQSTEQTEMAAAGRRADRHEAVSQHRAVGCIGEPREPTESNEMCFRVS